MLGTMARTVAEKLQVKPQDEVLVAGTDEQRALLAPLPDGATIVDGIDRDTEGVVVAFVLDREGLDALISADLPRLTSFRAAWIAYLKGGRADINRDSIWKRLDDVGWTLTANVSISEEWSAVRLKRVG